MAIVTAVAAMILLYRTLNAQVERESKAVYGREVREIRIVGNRHTKEYIIRRELVTKVGEPYTESGAEKDFQRLDRLNIFSDVQFRTIEDDSLLIVEVVVRENFPFLPSIGFSVTEENGVSFGGGVETLNLFGRAVYSEVFGQFGGQTWLGFRLTNPWLFGNHFGYELRLFHRNRENKLADFKEKSTEVSLVVTSWIREHGRVGGLFRFESVGSDTVGPTLSPDKRDNMFTGAFGFGWDSRDLISNPSRGLFGYVELHRTGLFGWGQGNSWQLIIDLAGFIPLARRHTLHLASLTELRTGTIGKDVAQWQLFGIGGTNSIRGWTLNSQTGKNETLNTIEYRYTAIEPRPVPLIFGLEWRLGLQFAALADLGRAWSTAEEFAIIKDGRFLPNFIAGYGLGARILMPFGMLRFDFALGESGKGIIFSFGGGEKSIKQRERVR